MNNDQFAAVLEGQFDLVRGTLQAKAAEYADDVDRLQNFRRASTLEQVSMEQALAGMMAKHTISIYDMIGSGKHYELGQWDEKITDHINYLILLRAIVVESMDEWPVDRSDNKRSPVTMLGQTMAEAMAHAHNPKGNN